MARCLTPDEIKEQLELLQEEKEKWEEKKEDKKSEIEELKEALTINEDELSDINSRLESIEEEIADLENYEDPRSREEQKEDATRQVSLWLQNDEPCYRATLGKSAKEIKVLCYQFWPDGLCENESLENVDWNEIEEDCKDPNTEDDCCSNCGKQADNCHECLCTICDYCQEFEPCYCEQSVCLTTIQPANTPTKNPFSITFK